MSNKYFSILMKYILLWVVVLLSTPIQVFSFGYEFPEQGVALNTETQVLLIFDAPADYVKVTPTVTPFPYFVSSDAAKLRIDGDTTPDNFKESKSIPIKVLDNGEYNVQVKATLFKGTSEPKEWTRARTFSVVAEDGKVWFGADSVRNCIRAKHNWDPEKKKFLTEDDERNFDNEMKSRGEVTFKRVWVWKGPKNDPKNSSDPLLLDEFPMQDGIKIIVKDNDHPKYPLQKGYLVNGEFKFHKPSSYTVTIESEFAGLNLDGSIDTLGKGIGNFQVVNTSGKLYQQQVSVKDGLQHVSEPNDLTGKMWAVFHGMAEMVRLAKQELQIYKEGGLKVTFPSPSNEDNSLCRSKYEIHIVLDDWYDWDTVAHEFGHAIGQEYNIVTNSCGGNHDGTNQYDYDKNKNPDTYKHKANSLDLAFSEGFATWFGVALLEKSDKNFWKIGDQTKQNTSEYEVPDEYSISEVTNYIPINKGDTLYPYSSNNLENATNNIPSETKYSEFSHKVYVPETSEKKYDVYGEDAENAIASLLWDLHDNSPEEVNKRATCADCKDKTSLGLKGVWDILNGGNIANISDFWHKLLEKAFDSTMTDFLNEEKPISGEKLKKVENAAYTFVEFGMAPFLEIPSSRLLGFLWYSPDKIDTTKQEGPSFKWKQMKTGSLLGLNKFTLALYSSDLKTLVFTKDEIKRKFPVDIDPNEIELNEFVKYQEEFVEYTLEAADLKDIQTKLQKLQPLPKLLVAAVIGETDDKVSSVTVKGPNTVSGPYFSNFVRVDVKCQEVPKTPENNRRGVKNSIAPGICQLNDNTTNYWTGNASIISYHGKNANEDNYDYPYSIIRDVIALHPNPDKQPVGFFQWQVSRDNCDRLKIMTNNLPHWEENVDITIGSWSDRGSDKLFEDVTLPFIIGEENTSYTFSDNDGQWYVVGVAFRNPVNWSAELGAICTSELPTEKPYTTGKSIILDGSHKWNGNASVISGMFTPLANDKRYGVFKDVTQVHPSPENPSEKQVVFFQWMSSDICPTLTIDVMTTDDPPEELDEPDKPALERNVKIGIKKWNDDSYQLTPVTLPYILRKKGIWNVIQVAFDNPVTQPILVEASCPGYKTPIITTD
jgi:hypothetical protein